ncbi:hypothetical protein KR222_007711 [Zaprionus bogoriensis]|nr:hypothetical protein KR222_007711 [Zaprionus bogoriensis]
MSEPQSSYGMRLAYNSLLLVTSGLTASKMTASTHPFAYSACLVGGAVAVLGLLRALLGNDRDPGEMRMLRDINHSVLELVPLPLVNMELYMLTQGLGAIVLSHSIFVLPLLLDLRCSIWYARKHCDLTETLRDLTLLGCITSLGYLAVRELNWVYARMALTMLLVKYVPVLLDYIDDGTGEDLIVCGSALFFYQLGKVTALADK